MKKLWSLLLVLLLVDPALADIDSFREAKVLLKKEVYFDQTRAGEGTFYCGCDWLWVGESGGRVDLASCGYEVRAQENRAGRTEWEHVVPAWLMGHQRQCWQHGGRKNCAENDPLFRIMEADPHNLVVSIGEANADRSNYRFGMLPEATSAYGKCDLKVDFKSRVVEPRDEVKGQVARIYFYIHDRYNLRMSRQQQQLMMAWDRQHPVMDWERERDTRIARLVGHHNPFVTGEKAWTLGHKNSAIGLQVASYTATPARAQAASSDDSSRNLALIRGNKRSRVYHLPEGCPSYSRVSERNVEEFRSEDEAREAGYRKAGNCL
ncbi:endonuclease [Marinobacterium aestuariivivens]|uniref:Endonuclease n=1 Tax=Marinobacterium aestuariivivens TaxID=1698799 RepID=A0ABW2A9I7_9GAMM